MATLGSGSGNANYPTVLWCNSARSNEPTPGAKRKRALNKEKDSLILKLASDNGNKRRRNAERVWAFVLIYREAASALANYWRRR